MPHNVMVPLIYMISMMKVSDLTVRLFCITHLNVDIKFKRNCILGDVAHYTFILLEVDLRERRYTPGLNTIMDQPGMDCELDGTYNDGENATYPG